MPPLTCARLIRVSASTKNKYSPRAARAPAFLAAAIWRRLIGITFAPVAEAISGVASVDASSTTMISYGCFEPDAASRIAVKVAESSCSSLYAGTINEIIGLLSRAISPVINGHATSPTCGTTVSGHRAGNRGLLLFQDIVLGACFESKAGFF